MLSLSSISVVVCNCVGQWACSNLSTLGTEVLGNPIPPAIATITAIGLGYLAFGDRNIKKTVYLDSSVVDKTPKEIVLLIFSHLPLWEQIKISRVCKNWRNVVFTSLEAKYPGKLFPEEKFPVRVIDIALWIKCFGEKNLTKLGVNITEFLPNKRAAIARLVYLYSHAAVENNAGASILTTPKGITIKKIIDLMKERGKDGANLAVVEECLEDFINISLEKTCVNVLTNNVLKGSRGQPLEQQEELVAKLGCELPEANKVISLAMVTFIIFNDRLFGSTPMTMTRCKEMIGMYNSYDKGLLAIFNLSVGDFNQQRLAVTINEEEYTEQSLGAVGSIDVPIKEH